MTDFIAGGDFAVNTDTRTVRGLLLPYDEQTQAQNSTQISFARGTITVPADVSALNANRNHDRYDPVARFTQVEDTERGIVASFAVSRNPEGDELLDQIKQGTLRKLSAEVSQIVKQGTKAISSKLTGAAFVPEGAFASAALFALDAIVDAPADTPAAVVVPEVAAPLDPNADGVLAITASTAPESVAVTVTDQETPLTYTQKQEAVVLPNTLNAGTSSVPAQLTKNELFALILDAKQNGTTDTLLAALSDVKTTGVGSVGINSIAPDFVGQVWSGNTFNRRVIPLLRQGTLTKAKTTGWRFVVRPQVAAWAGDKTDVPSNAPTTEAVTWTAEKMAGGWDIAREFYDFNDLEAIDEFLKLAATDYARKSDSKTLVNLLAGATSSTLIAAQTSGYGGGAAVSGISQVTQGIIRGAMRVIGNDATPTYAIVNPTNYESLIYTKELDSLAFLGQSLGLSEGVTAGLTVIPHAGIAAGTVLVGDKMAAANYEMAGAPIRVNALDIARGGVDEALFGYFQTRIEYPAGLQLVTGIV